VERKVLEFEEAVASIVVGPAETGLDPGWLLAGYLSLGEIPL
jgi:hypothetical protein